MQRYFVKISYDGTAYSGWQMQKNASNTIQQKVNACLSTLLNEKIVVLGCCRTDAGVHAKGLYAHFDSGNLKLPVGKQRNLFLSNWLHRCNAILPKDISVDAILKVRKHASARFDATSRTYQYFIHAKPNPFLNNISYYYYSELDIVLMNKAAALLKKSKDFSAFSKVHTQVKTNLCKISKARWKRTDEGLVFTVKADRFLRGMVRLMVGTMISIGKHRMTLKEFQKIIDSKDCRNASGAVAACGLFLCEVEYPHSIFIK